VWGLGLGVWGLGFLIQTCPATVVGVFAAAAGGDAAFIEKDEHLELKV